MLKVIAVITALLACSAIQAEEKTNIFETATAPIRPITDPIVKRASEDFSAYILKGTRYEKAMQEHELRRDKQTLRVTRSLQECIKPGGLIDDEVQMCVNGTREKNWPSQNETKARTVATRTAQPRSRQQTMQVIRPLKECIKPNGLIDDDVKMCVNGTLQKKW